jgi:hypothetical protein
MKKCSWCGRENKDAANACGACGTPLTEEKKQGFTWMGWEGMLMKEFAPKVVARYPALAVVGRWWIWLLVAFLAALVAAFATHWIAFWIMAYVLSRCAAFARVASRLTPQHPKKLTPL